MQKIYKNRLVLTVALLAVVGVVGSAYTLPQSGPTTAHAQTSSVQSSTKNTQVGQDQDKEIQDDKVSPKPASTVQPKADTNENDQADSNSSTEVEDGN